MKIVYCLDSLRMGGAEKLVADYSIYLKGKGHDIDIVIFGYYIHSVLEKSLNKHKINIIYLQDKPLKGSIGKIFNKFEILFRWIRYLNKTKIDVVHAHLKTSNYLVFINSKKTKLLYTYHSNIERYINYFGKMWLYILKYLVCYRNMTTFVLNKKMLKDATKYVCNSNVYYLPNCVNFSEYQYDNYRKQEIKYSLDLKDENFLITHIGRLHPVKNHKKLIEIFRIIKQRNENAKLLIVGDGDISYTNEIKEMIREYNLMDDVKFLGVRDDVSDILCITDCLVFPSHQEGFPLTILEAQVLNIRTIVSKAVPNELVCNINCLQLDIDETAEKWTDYVFDHGYTNEAVKDIKQFDMPIVMEQLLQFYLKK